MKTGRYAVATWTAAAATSFLAATVATALTAMAGCSSGSSPSGSEPAPDATASNETGASADGGAGQGDDAAADASGVSDVSDAGSPPTPCSPATLLDPRPWETCEGDGYCVCYGYAPEAGSLFFDPSLTIMGIKSMQLPVPMKAGQPYSFSVSVTDNGFYGDVEFWGSTSQCGPGLEKLYTATLESKVYCADVHPSQDYTWVIFVERLETDSGAPAGEHSDTILACPTGRCGASP